jgi:predicted DNA-binding transcriptional regulator YafY
VLDLLAASHVLTTAEIAAATGASAATVRRDLVLLERLGFLVRIHGGAATRRQSSISAEHDEILRQLGQALATLRGGDVRATDRALRLAMDQFRRLPDTAPANRRDPNASRHAC